MDGHMHLCMRVSSTFARVFSVYAYYVFMHLRFRTVQCENLLKALEHD